MFDPSDLSNVDGGVCDLGSVPLFPLPNVVLLPRAILPLHLFEDRYKSMIRHVLAGDKRFAMALLRPGWEKDYYCRPAIEPVVCVGTVVAHERLQDGNYNILLQGTDRARIITETKSNYPFRSARLQRLIETPAPEPDLAMARKRLSRAFAAGPLAGTIAGRQFDRLIGSALSTADLADLIAFNFIEDVTTRQSLLEETSVLRRVEQVVAAVEAMCPVPVAACGRAFGRPSLN